MIGIKIIEEKKSKFNGTLRVVKSWGLGTYIQAGGLTQSGGIVENIWRKTLKRIKKLNPAIKNCLILGYGGGTVAKILKEYWPGIKIKGVDIDPEIVELGKKYLGNQNVKIDIGDASDELAKLNQKFDLIIVDLYNGDIFPEKFEKPVFVNKVNELLSKKGTAVFNRLYYGEKRPAAVKFGRKLEKTYKVDWYYPEANVMLICGSLSK